ncbi:MAG: 30S ribosomal protein S6 [Desulfatiglandaceae bacterium]|jgi:small subunit ribosomal protein S6
MRHYETIYIMRPSLAEGDYEEAQKKVIGLIETNQGVMVKIDQWGERTLAYPVKKMKKGYYVLLEYCGEAGLTEKLERVFKLDDSILKYQTVKISDNADLEALLPKKETPEGNLEAEVVAEESPEQETGETESDEVENGIR